VAGCRKRIGHGDAPPGNPSFKSRKEREAIAFGRSSKNDRVPDSELMVGGEIGSPRPSPASVFQRPEKAVAPAHDGEPRLSRRSPALFAPASEQFAENPAPVRWTALGGRSSKKRAPFPHCRAFHAFRRRRALWYPTQLSPPVLVQFVPRPLADLNDGFRRSRARSDFRAPLGYIVMAVAGTDFGDGFPVSGDENTLRPCRTP